MGQAVETVANMRGIAIGGILKNTSDIEGFAFMPDDISIAFTTPQAEAANIRALAARGVSQIVGTTGWEHDIDDLAGLVTRSNIGFLAATNFSLGVHAFMQVAQQAAQTLHKLKAYDLFIHEWHHAGKKDAPSGTARTLAETVLGAWPSKSHWVRPAHDRAPQPNELVVSSARGGHAFGQHDVVFDSLTDTVTLTHSSKGREAYASGAITAALWLQSKKGLYTLDDLLAD